MKNQNKQRILILTDLNQKSLNVVKSAANLACMMDASLEIFHVKKALFATSHGNQVSAIRAISQSENKMLGTLRNMAETIDKEYAVKTEYSYRFGNVKNEIKNIISRSQPDIVVVGKRASITPSYLGDKMLSFVLKNYKGSVLVADRNNVLEANQLLSLGVLGTDEIDSTNPVGATIYKHAQMPVRRFSTMAKNEVSENAVPTTANMVNYVFDQTNDVVDNIISYVSKSRVNLVYINNSNNPEKTNGFSKPQLNTLMKQVQASLLVRNN